MYKNIYVDSWNNDVHIWDDLTGYSKFKYNPYAYQIDTDGQYTTIDGHKVKRVSEWSEQAVKLGLVYEHDVSPTIRTLIDLYHETDEISTGLVILPLDIEVAKEGSYSTTAEANNTITSISYYSYKENLYYCLLLDKNKHPSEYDDVVEINLPDNKIKKVNAKYFTFKTEFDLLKVFLREYKLIQPDVITGWNVEFFDMPYLYNRISKILGKDWANGLSPLKICKQRPAGNFQQLKVSIAGVSILDYLELYKKFTYSESPNYKLDTICKLELQRGKVEYDGDLDTLYNTDIKKFAEYNIVDVELIVSLNEKLDLIDIARGICHKGHVPYEDFIYPSRYLDGASLVYCKRNNLIASSNKSEGKDNEEDSAEGAFVKYPTPGLYKWIIDIDLESLYPANLRTLNISPETKFARILDYNEDDFINNTDRNYNIELIKDRTPTGMFSDTGFKSNKFKLHGSEELRKYMSETNLSLSTNGILYSLDKVGLIPSILTLWFQERKEFQKLMNEHGAAGNKELKALYDKKQLVTKILLNSFYGVLLLRSFRFYDRENGEAVTSTGRSILGFSMKAANLIYNKELNTKETDYCIYGDTDSVFFSTEPLLRHRFQNMDSMTDLELINESLKIANQVQTFINTAYNKYAKIYHGVDKHVWFIKQELVARRGLWLGSLKQGEIVGTKKRYALHIVNEKGLPKDKLDVKGIDVVRSNFPKAFRQFMKEILNDILHDKDKNILNKKVQEFGYIIKNTFINDIMLPIGVKDIQKWKTDGKHLKGTPVHVKAAMNYNKLLDLWKINNIPRINDGDKILWCYVNKNEYGFESMALTGNDDPLKILGFVSTYIDRTDLFDNTLKSKLQSFWDALNWGAIITNENTNKFFKF